MINNIQNISKQPPFKVPENYFENFKKDIMLQVSQQQREQKSKLEVRSTKKVNLWKRTVAWSTIAAIFLGVIVTFNITLQNPGQTAPSKTPNQGITASTKVSEESEFFQYIEEQSMRGTYNETLLRLSDDDNY